MQRVLDMMILKESRPERVGPRVTAMREALRLTKAEFADSLGLDRSSLSKIERGKAGLDIATGELVAQLYGFGLDYIYRGELSDAPLALRAELLRQIAALPTT